MQLFTSKNNFVFLYLYLILFLINFVFFILTKDNSWVSDDYAFIFGAKLYNLIQDKIFFIETVPTRFIPLFFLINQFIPESYSTWHFIVVMFYFFTSIVLFKITLKLFNNPIFAALTSILFSINYSISLDSLSWGVYYSHIFNVFFGLLSLYILIFFIAEKNKRKKTLLIFSYLTILLLSISLSEGSLIYILINLFVYMFFYFLKKNYLQNFFNIFIIIFPLLFFFIINLIFFSHPLKILSDRVNLDYESKYGNIYNKDNNSEIYFYKSTYAPRNAKGYFFKLTDNILKSVNLSQLENIIKNYEYMQFIKIFLKNNYYKIISIFFIISIIFSSYLAIFLKEKKALKNYKFFLLFYLFVLIIYTFIYARTNLSIALSVTSALLISKIIIDFWNYKKKYISTFILIIFLTPSILNGFTKFNISGDFNAKNNFKKFKEINTSTENKDKSILNQDNRYKFYYFYKNFNENKSMLKKKFKDHTYIEFQNDLIYLN